MKTTTLLLLSFFVTSCASQKEYSLLVGTYTRQTTSKGIYVLKVNPLKSNYTVTDVADDIENPGFLAVNKIPVPQNSSTPGDSGNFTDESGNGEMQMRVYAVSEVDDSAVVHAYSLSAASGRLTKLNSKKTRGSGSCSVAITDKHVVLANYNSGNLSVFTLTSDGLLDKEVQSVQHIGGSINPDRQNGPHAHQVIFDSSGKYLFSNNLGNDLLYVYRYNPDDDNEPFVLTDSLLMEKGGGPRHLAIHRDSSLLYVLQELTGTISIVHVESGRLKFKGSSTIITKKGNPGAADIHLSSDFKYLYASNRNEFNQISVFSLQKPSRPELLEQYSSGGKTPRNFMITSDGNYLFAGNQNSGEIAVFERNRSNGKLRDTGFRIPIPAPVCHIEF